MAHYDRGDHEDVRGQRQELDCKATEVHFYYINNIFFFPLLSLVYRSNYSHSFCTELSHIHHLICIPSI